MKRVCAILAALAVCLTALSAFAEDTLSSATVSITALPALREHPDAHVLVLYFSTDDTVKAVARTIADELNAAEFELVPEIPYTEADLAYYTGGRADQEQSDGAARPALAAWPDGLERYDTLFLGYPIWHGQAPKLLYTLLEGIDVRGKTIVPFCTSASSGAGSSAKNLQALTDGAALWLEAKRIDNKSTADDIRAWVRSLNLAERENGMQMKIDGTAVTVAWEENDSVAALKELGPCPEHRKTFIGHFVSV